MCGIAGLFGPSASKEALAPMVAALRHRGPDDEGLWADAAAGVALGMRRLAVIDVPGGKQPATNAACDGKGAVVAVYNGEIYNFREVRAALEKKGHKFLTSSDTEIIPHAYEEWGVDCLKRFNGMFAFALWDGAAHRLLLARDPLGVKPLYYSFENGLLSFSSELKSLLTVKGFSREISDEALGHYLSGGAIPAPHTIFRRAKKLPPGSWLLADRNGIRSDAYWRPPAPQEGPAAPVDREELGSLLEQAVKSQLISDVPLGVFLSGGLDSSAITAYAARHVSGPLKTFSIGYAAPDQGYNELNKARLVAEKFGCEHREFILSPRIQDLLLPLVRGFDEPFADSSAVPNYLISRETRKHVTVALTGVGGDEIFAGYPRYMGLLAAEKFQTLPGPLRTALGAAAGLLPDPGGSVNWLGRAKRFLRHGGLPLPDQYARWTSFLSPELLERLYPSRRAPAPGLSDASPDALAQGDLLGYLPTDLLCLADRMSMAHSLEARVPFCDIPLVEFMARVPLSVKLAGGGLKSLMKDVLAPVLPPQILSQEKKGFSIPLARWMREELGPLLDDCLGPAAVKARGLLDSDVVADLRRRHASKRENHADALWSLLVLEIWHREYVDGKP